MGIGERKFETNIKVDLKAAEECSTPLTDKDSEKSACNHDQECSIPLTDKDPEKPACNHDQDCFKSMKKKDPESIDYKRKQGILQKVKSAEVLVLRVLVGVFLIAVIILIALLYVTVDTSSTVKEKTITKNVQCEPGWIVHNCPQSSECYYLSTEYDTWINSQRFCKIHHSTLAIIDNKEEYDFLQGAKENENYWIGLGRTEDDSGWVWTNGKLYSEDLFSLERLYVEPGDLEYAFLNYLGVKSGSGNRDEKRWICKTELIIKPP